MNKVVIRVDGGLVTGIYSTDADLKIVIIDLDNTRVDDVVSDGVLEPDTTFNDGEAHLLFKSPEAIEILKSFKF